MSSALFLIHAARAIIDGVERAATVVVQDGTIVAVGPPDADYPSADGGLVHRLAEDEVLIPGIVDSHVHVNEPGRTEWEGFASATDAARAGGVTTIIDMPLNSLPPTLTAEALRLKQDAAAGQLRVDVGFWGGLVPSNLDALPELFAAGVFGVKCFLQDSGVPEFPPVDSDTLLAAMRVVAELDGLVLVHAEDPGVLESAPPPEGASYQAFVESRPDRAESQAISVVIEAVRATGCRAHIVHVSSAAGAKVIAKAKAQGLPISAETCPHYLTLAAEGIPDGATQYKCCPPIRGYADQDALWSALETGAIDIVVTDHSPSTPDRKHLDDGDLGLAWGGIASVQFGFAATWAAAAARGIGLPHVVHWMSTAPADLVGLPRKGRIAVGADADLLVLAPDEQFVVTEDQIRHRHRLTPYLGQRLRGVVRDGWLGGRPLSDPATVGALLRSEAHVSH